MILLVTEAFGANEDSFDDNENPLGVPLTSTHFAPNSRKSRRGDVVQYNAGSSWDIISGADDGWQMLLKHSCKDGAPDTFILVAETSHLGTGRDACRISLKCIEAMCAEPPKDESKATQKFYIVNINGRRRIVMQQEHSPTHSVLGTLTFDSSQAAKNYLKMLGYKLHQL
jgi:hypothetical protein